MSIIIHQSTTSLPMGYCSIDPSEDQIISLVFKYQNSPDKKEKDAVAQILIDAFECDIKTLAKRLSGNKARVSTDELAQIGRLILLDKAEKFEFSRGVKFWTYAGKRIFGAMKDEIRSELAQQGIDRHGEQKRPRTISLSDSLPNSHNQTVNDILVGQAGLDLTEVIDPPFIGYTFPKQDHPIYHLGNVLNRREMIMLDLYYGLTGKEHVKTMQEIGEIFEVSESRISQILGDIGKRLEPYEKMIASGEFPKESFKCLADPVFQLLSNTASKKHLPFPQEDLKFVAACEDLLSEQEKRILTLIRGTDNEYGIPHTNSELIKELKLTRSRELPAYKEPLGEKLLTLIQLTKRKTKQSESTTKGWFVKPAEIKIIFDSIDNGICDPKQVISALLPRIGYKPLETSEKIEASNRQELLRIINNPELECHYSRGVVVGIMNAALTEPADSFHGKLLRKYPETFEFVLESMADKYMLQVLKEAKHLAETNGSLTYEELGDIYKRICHGISPSVRTLKIYAEAFDLNVTPPKRGGYRKTA